MLSKFSKIQIAIVIAILIFFGAAATIYIVQKAPAEMQTGKAKKPPLMQPKNPNADSGKGGKTEKKEPKDDGCDANSCKIR